MSVVRSASAELLAEMLPACIQRVPADTLQEAVAWTKRVGDLPGRTKVLAALLPRLREGGLSESIAETLDVALNVGDDSTRIVVETLIQLGAALPAADEGMSLRVVSAASDNAALARLFVILLRSQRVPEQERNELLEEAITATRAIGDGTVRALMLGMIAARLPRDRWSVTIEEAVALTQAANDADDAIFATLLLLPFRPPDEVAATVDQLREEALRMAEEDERRLLLAVLACAGAFLSAAPVADLLARTKSVFAATENGMPADRIEAIAAAIVLVFAGPLPAEQRIALVDTLERNLGAIDEPDMRAWAWSATAPHVPTQRLWPWLREILAMAAQQTRPDALILLALVHGIVHEVLAHNPGLGGNRIAESPLARLGGDVAVTETLAAIAEVCTTWP